MHLSDVIIVLPGEPYTGWEKLFLPFDRPPWVWLGICFTVAFLVFFLITVSKSQLLYNNIVGPNVTAPALNVVAIFMGIIQLSLPQRNGTRFLLINFVVFCLERTLKDPSIVEQEEEDDRVVLTIDHLDVGFIL